jgi:phosphate transport system permease protein
MATISAARERVKDEQGFIKGLANRHLRGAIWKYFFQAAIALGILALVILMLNVVNRIGGLVAVRQAVDPATLAEGRALDSLTTDELADVLIANLPGAGRVLVRDTLIGVQNYDANRDNTMAQFLPSLTLPEATAAKPLSDLQPEDTRAILTAAFTQAGLLELVTSEVVGLEVAEAWSMSESLLNRSEIETQVASIPDLAGTTLQWNWWLNFDFLTGGQSNTPAETGIRTALFGTLWVLALTVLIAFPLGVGTAIYLEEYSTGDNWFERLIETNIRNLAGVPSIIYGLLGLAIFVRALEGITQGRTVISAALTMALLILPVVIINAQEALRAVPPSIREASFGLGATKWQTIWNQVLPAALPGILTGTILGMSRAIGETAPLIIIGASTFISVDPNGPLSKFTVIPIQIYNWSKSPGNQFQDIAAAGIVLLLIVLLLFNATAIILRQRFRRKLSG